MEKGKVWRKERYGGRRGMTKKSFLGSLGIAGWKKERYGGRRGMKDGEVWRKKRFVEGEVWRKEVWRNER